MFNNKKSKLYLNIVKYDSKPQEAITTLASLSLQILLLNGTIKLVGSEFGKAQYQYKTGDKKGLEIYINKEEGYFTLSEYIKENNLKKDSFENIDNSKGRLYYSSTGLLRIYPQSYLNTVAKSRSKDNRSILEKIFNHS